MKKLITAVSIALSLTFSMPSLASALIHLNGKFYSSNDREIGIQMKKTVYFISRSSMTPEECNVIINAKTPVQLTVNPKNLTRVIQASR